MFLIAADALAGQVAADDYEIGRLYPPLSSIRRISLHIAAAVAELAFEEGLASVERPEDITAFVKSQMFEPQYSEYV